MADTLHAPASRGPDANAATELTLPAARDSDHSAASIVAGQVLRGLRQVLRTPIAAFFTLLLPLAFLLLIGSITGNAVIDQSTGTRVAQFTTPGLLAFAVAMAVFSNPAIAIVIAREAGVLKRLRGTPLPAWAFLVGTLLASTAFALAASALMVGVAMVVFDVSLPAASLPAAIVTLVFGIATFAALGFALAALAPSVGAAQGVANGTVILLAFVSEIFLVAAEVPRWLSLIGDIFPLKHLVNGLQDAFDPYLVGSAWGVEHLAVMAAWALVGAVVAVRWFRWEPRGGSGSITAPRDAAVQGATQHLPTAHLPVSAGVAAIGASAGEVVLPGPEAGHPTRATMLWAQVVTTTRAAGRDPWSLVFAVAMPTLLVLLLPAVFGSGEMPWLDDMRFPQFYAPSMAVYGIAVHAFVNVPEGLAAARERGVLKRLRGTPLPPSVFVGGRLGGIVLVGLGICVLTFGVGIVVYDVEVGLARLPVLLITFLVGTLAIAALGLLVASVVPSPASVPAVALGILLPLAFVSDIFLLGDVPTMVAWIGWTFPLKHFVYAMVAAADPAATAGGWAALHLGVLLAWGAVGAALAIRWFRWEPARGADRTTEPSHPEPDDA